MTEEINKQYILVSMYLNKTIEACHVHVFYVFCLYWQVCIRAQALETGSKYVYICLLIYKHIKFCCVA